ncbi:MAG: peptidylprolyl isomerase [Myxococcota bacterium]
MNRLATRSILLLCLACGSEESAEEAENVEVEASEGESTEAEGEAEEDDDEDALLADGDEDDTPTELVVRAEELSLDDETRARVAPEERHLFHILVRYRGAERAGDATRSRDDAEARAQEALEAARAGDFSAVAAAMSDDTANKDHGGDMGMLGRGLLPEALDDALFAMEIGEIRGPVESPLGFHVLLRGERME